MPNREDYHERLFRVVSADITRRVQRYNEIESLPQGPEREESEKAFIEEQKAIVSKFLKDTKRVRGLIEEENLGKFDRLVDFVKKLRRILQKDHFTDSDSQQILAEIETELASVNMLVNERGISGFTKRILSFCRRNKHSVIILDLVLLGVAVLSISVDSNFHLIPTDSTHFKPDNIAWAHWAMGADRSYGFHTMLDKIAHYQSPLEGLQYDTKEGDKTKGSNPINLHIYNGALDLLPKNFQNTLAGNIEIEIQALNRGETVIIIWENKEVIFHILFHQDSPSAIIKNIYELSDEQLKAIYTSLWQSLEVKVNTN